MSGRAVTFAEQYRIEWERVLAIAAGRPADTLPKPFLFRPSHPIERYLPQPAGIVRRRVP